MQSEGCSLAADNPSDRLTRSFGRWRSAQEHNTSRRASPPPPCAPPPDHSTTTSDHKMDVIDVDTDELTQFLLVMGARCVRCSGFKMFVK